MVAWSEYKRIAEERGALALELYVIVSTPSGTPEEVKANLPDHLAYQAAQEAEGTSQQNSCGAEEESRIRLAEREFFEFLQAQWNPFRGVVFMVAQAGEFAPELPPDEDGDVDSAAGRGQKACKPGRAARRVAHVGNDRRVVIQIKLESA